MNDTESLHLVNRLSFGPRSGEIQRVKSIGKDAYIKEQLYPESLPEPLELKKQLGNLETFNLPIEELVNQYQAMLPQSKKGEPRQLQVRKVAKQHMLKVLNQAIEARLSRSVLSLYQLQEVMTDFWFNHFNVHVGKGGIVRLVIGNYEQVAIRSYVFGKFRDLLGATARHPAMIFYLDNRLNSKPVTTRKSKQTRGLNENYARELLELHTLGVDGGYTQQDVIALAKIFTGWGLKDNLFYFDPKRHDESDKILLGQTIKGEGQAEGEKALDILARHPATAKHISYKLAQYFVADEPPVSLVNQLSQRFTQTDGDIRQVLETLFYSPEFSNPQYYQAKFKTPYQYVVSSLRATNSEIKNALPVNRLLQQMSMGVYGCPTPNGYANTQDFWLNPDGMTQRLNFVTLLSQDRLPFLISSRVQASDLATTLRNSFSNQTRNAIAASDPKIQAALMLGSPEFMYH